MRAIISGMDALIAQTLRYVQRHQLLRRGETVVVGVSGGPDSVCLLHVLHRLAPELDLHLHVAHLNHGLRGAESDADAEFVAALAAEWGLPCTVGRADVAALAEVSRLSLEEAARQARYRFLAQVAEAATSQTIAVGHNADDQAETVLMHFLRGSGVAGLRGMLPRTRLSVQGSRGVGEWGSRGAGEQGSRGTLPFSLSPFPPCPFWLVRPLLAAPRADIAAYCAEHGLQPRFDRSNEDTTFFRNRLRHELLPILEAYNPAIRDLLAHTAEVLAGDYDLLRADLDAAWARVAPGTSDATGIEASAGYVGPADAGGIEASAGYVGQAPNRLKARFQGGDNFDDAKDCFGAAAPRNDGDVCFDLVAWRGLPLGLQRATIREAIHRLRHSLRNINWEHVEAAVWLAREGATGQAATLAAGLELQIGYATLRIAAEGAAWPVVAPQVAGPIPLAAPGMTIIGGGWQVVVQRVRREDLPADYAANRDPWMAFLDADAAGPELTLRPRLPGDRFQPHGLGGHSTKLNGFMINAKIPKDARPGWPLLVGRAGIAWVCGVRVDDRAAVRDETREVWHVQLGRQVDK